MHLCTALQSHQAAGRSEGEESGKEKAVRAENWHEWKVRSSSSEEISPTEKENRQIDPIKCPQGCHILISHTAWQNSNVIGVLPF